jgi:hypothetical protein
MTGGRSPRAKKSALPTSAMIAGVRGMSALLRRPVAAADMLQADVAWCRTCGATPDRKRAAEATVEALMISLRQRGALPRRDRHPPAHL